MWNHGQLIQFKYQLTWSNGWSLESSNQGLDQSWNKCFQVSTKLVLVGICVQVRSWPTGTHELNWNGSAFSFGLLTFPLLYWFWDEHCDHCIKWKCYTFGFIGHIWPLMTITRYTYLSIYNSPIPSFSSLSTSFQSRNESFVFESMSFVSLSLPMSFLSLLYLVSLTSPPLFTY